MDNDKKLSLCAIERDWHPVPQEHTNPDHMVVPMVLPAHFDRIRFDENNLAQTTFLDARSRMYSELMKVAGFNFIECFTLPTGTTSRTSRAIDVLQVAYLATECVKELADLFDGDDKFPVPVECPRNLIWCCAYTPPGIENPYWLIERSMCQYTLFVLSMQMAFLNLHIHRRPKYTVGGKGDGATPEAEKAEKAKNPARVCRMHLDAIVASWEAGYYSQLASYGMVPEKEIMQKTYGDIIALMHLDYTIFHVELPMFMDAPAPWRRVQEGILVPRDLMTDENVAEKPSKIIRTHTMETLALILVAHKKAVSVYTEVFAETLHDSSGTDAYMKSLVIRHSCLTQLAKYLIQAPLVYRFLIWVLKFNVAVRDRRMNLIERCFKQINAIFKDPCFRLFIYSGSDDPRYAEQIKAIYSERAKASSQFDPNVKIMVAQNSDYMRTDVAIPSEIYECDLLFSIWSMETFAQFPPILINSFSYIVNGLNGFMQRSTMIDRTPDEEDDRNASQLPGIDDELAKIVKSADKIPKRRGYIPSEQATGFVNKFITSFKRAMPAPAEAASDAATPLQPTTHDGRGRSKSRKGGKREEPKEPDSI